MAKKRRCKKNKTNARCKKALAVCTLKPNGSIKSCRLLRRKKGKRAKNKPKGTRISRRQRTIMPLDPPLPPPPSRFRTTAPTSPRFTGFGNPPPRRKLFPY